MSDNPLAAFLSPRKISDEHAKVVVSDFFKDENGEPIPFEIRAISEDENVGIKKATRKTKDGQGNEVMDVDEYAGRLIAACTVFPNFSSVELGFAYGTSVPYQLPRKMLKSGELTYLLQQINAICGFDNAAQRRLDEAKN